MTDRQIDEIRSRYGDEYLLRQLAEECMELGHAALKRIRAMRGETPVGLDETKTALIEEMADVDVMLGVVEGSMDGETQDRLLTCSMAKEERMVARLLGE